ncbi:hypothetical protein RU639_011303 [Aspergillus parasiticus]
MPGYEYSPLPTGSNSIRVLLLLPSTDDTASINCQLINYFLPTTGDGYLPYEALSYVWGSESTPRCIFLDGTTLSITDNLYAALLHLRDHQLARILWVDAVCINQQDEQEKGYQIQLMPTIYSQASHVIVWLGRAADHSDRALDDIRLAAEESTAPWGKEAYSTTILMLLQRPWFRRIWILQEISAARSILIMSDLLPNYQLPWDILLQRVIMSILPKIHSVETWPDKEIAVLQGRGQRVKISFKESLESNIYMAIWGTEWTLQATARSIKEGDLINAVHQEKGGLGRYSDTMLEELQQKLLQSEKTSFRGMLLVWNWEVPRANLGEEGQSQVSKSFRDAVSYLEIDFERKRQHDVELIIKDITMIGRDARGLWEANHGTPTSRHWIRSPNQC